MNQIMNVAFLKRVARTSIMLLLIAVAGAAFGAENETARQGTQQEQKVKGTGGEALVNINTADEQALDTLPRIGPAIAKRIIAFREENGPFKSLEELMNVKGIGEKTFEKLKDLIKI